MTFDEELEDRISAYEASNDVEALDDLLLELYEAAERGSRPFEAAIRLKPEPQRRLAEAGLESGLGLDLANRISRAKRAATYRLKTAFGFDGLRIVDEGDSWHQYPVLLHDIVDHLNENDDMAIYSLSAGGELLSEMTQQREYLSALSKTGAQAMILSGGGNDVFGEGRFADMLLPYEEGRDPTDLVDMAKLDAVAKHIHAHYSQILVDVASHFPGVRVFGHAYDLPYPKENGPWLGRPLAARGIPLGIGREVVRVIFDRFADMLSAFEQEFAHFKFVNLRDKVGKAPNSWFDELHPRNAGYGRAAEAIAEAIATARHSGDLELEAAPTMVDGFSFEQTVPVIVLDPGHGGTSKLGGSSWNNATGPHGTLEKTLTLDVAKRARDLLEGRGHKVLLTRTTDRNLSLSDRAKLARTNDADVFVSIHFNASENHDAQGTETFVHPRHNPRSRALCLALQAAMVSALGLRDRNALHPGGIKTGKYGVIRRDRHAKGTAVVLHEVSFLDRADEERRLMSTAYRDRIAKALANGIDAFLNDDLEAWTAPLDPENLGDAIELSAVEAGLTVSGFLGFAETASDAADFRVEDPVGAPVGGHMIVADLALPEAGAEFGNRVIARIAESVMQRSDTVGLSDDGPDTVDEDEFRDVPVGEGFVLPPPGTDFETTTSALRTSFAGIQGSSFAMDRFEAFIASLNLRWFEPSEFLYPGAGNSGGECAGKNTLPPENLWANIANTARMLDEIRDRLGVAVRITSGYRSPAYNSCIGGAKRSWHMRFNAIDWTAASGSFADWLATSVDVRQSDPRFTGAVLAYENRNFIHIDTRGKMVGP